MAACEPVVSGPGWRAHERCLAEVCSKRIADIRLDKRSGGFQSNADTRLRSFESLQNASCSPAERNSLIRPAAKLPRTVSGYERR